MCDEEGARSKVKGTPSDLQPGMELVTEMGEEEIMMKRRKLRMVRLKKFQILRAANEDTRKADEEFLVPPSGCSSLCLKL